MLRSVLNKKLLLTTPQNATVPQKSSGALRLVCFTQLVGLCWSKSHLFTEAEASELGWPEDLSAACKEPGRVEEMHLSSDLSAAQRGQIREPLCKFAPGFSSTPRRTHLASHVIDTGGTLQSNHVHTGPMENMQPV